MLIWVLFLNKHLLIWWEVSIIFDLAVCYRLLHYAEIVIIVISIIYILNILLGILYCD